jgi:hypothetical protein
VMAPRTLRSWCSATNSPSCAAKSHDSGWSPPTGRCSPRSAACCPEPAGRASSYSRRRCCAGTAAWSPAPGPPRTAGRAGHRWTRKCSS